ncbi:hypothetical protein Back11_18140 [Paenibacillus baekrokdamisoli]|uniref:Uncharacterized protein n=1 Tax=Paenibacillus baekrokdamisoli TaxID=1712516 RepID=A0A3G9JBT7_9BACL|nr:hypothetical protein [Paenibacillus baekrokdamisoli]MBB3072409.1 Zn-dependent metalloprotease [Paenibacillus baekrokdamisoli]BBH20469.1 hypothetical protein Back11_18140 [Paenibacillus baekrokdamisoli]
MRQCTAWIILFILFLSMPAPLAAANYIPKQATTMLNKLSEASSGNLQISWNDETNTPFSLIGALNRPSRSTSDAIVHQFLTEYKSLYGLQDIHHNLKVTKVEQTKDKMIQVHLQHIVYKTPVWQDGLIVTLDQVGVIQRVEGVIHPNMEKTLFHRPLHAAITRTQAINKAKAWIGTEVIAKDTTINLNYLSSGSRIVLVYAVSFHLLDSESKVTVLVHSLTGRIFDYQNGISG